MYGGAQRLTPGMHRERWAAWPGHGMWEQGPDRLAGVEASRLVHRPRLDPYQETELWGHGGVCDGRSTMWASCASAVPYILKVCPKVKLRLQVPTCLSCVGHGVSIGISVPVVVSVAGWLEVYMGWTHGWCTAGLR